MSRTATTHVAPPLGRFLLTQRHRGACTQQTAALFFDDGGGRGAKKRQEQAKAICRLCPILQACRAYARADPGLEGIWGGESQDERHAARRKPRSDGLPAGDNQEGRRLAGGAAELAHRHGLHAAARALKVPPTTLQRVFALYGLDQPRRPTGSLPPAPASPPATSPPTTSSSRHRGRRSRSSSPFRAELSSGLATPTSRPPDPPPIRHESPSMPRRPKERT